MVSSLAKAATAWQGHAREPHEPAAAGAGRAAGMVEGKHVTAGADGSPSSTAAAGPGEGGGVDALARAEGVGSDADPGATAAGAAWSDGGNLRRRLRLKQPLPDLSSVAAAAMGAAQQKPLQAQPTTGKGLQQKIGGRVRSWVQAGLQASAPAPHPSKSGEGMQGWDLGTQHAAADVDADAAAAGTAAPSPQAPHQPEAQQQQQQQVATPPRQLASARRRRQLGQAGLGWGATRPSAAVLAGLAREKLPAEAVRLIVLAHQASPH